MIGRREMDNAAEEAVQEGAGDWRHGLVQLGFDLRVVEEYAERALEQFNRRGLEFEEATKGGFRLGLQLGFRIARAQRRRG